MEMKAPKLQQIAESARFSGLDLIVKYAVLLSWFVYGAGLTKISGFLRTLGVPTEPSTYSLPTVLSYGAYSLRAILEMAGIPVVFLKLCEKQNLGRLWRLIGWTMPGAIFLMQNYWLLEATAPIRTRVSYALCLLPAAYMLVYLFASPRVRDSSVGTQVLVAAVLFFLFVEGAGYGGDLEAYSAMSTAPSIQFLLAPEAVSGASKLGIRFSTSEPGLTVPLNVVAFSEKMFYVKIPVRLDATQVQTGTRLDIENQVTVGIPRDKVILASTHR